MQRKRAALEVLGALRYKTRTYALGKLGEKIGQKEWNGLQCLFNVVCSTISDRPFGQLPSENLGQHRGESRRACDCSPVSVHKECAVEGREGLAKVFRGV